MGTAAIPSLPSELWFQTFSHLSIIEDVLESEPPTATHNLPEEEDRLIAESIAVKHALSLVSRQFYLVSRPVVLEVLSIRSAMHMRSLASVLREDTTGTLETAMARWTKRLDIHLGQYDMSLSVGRADSCIGRRAPNSAMEHHSLEDIATILRSCPALNYLRCCIPEDLAGTDGLDSFNEALTEVCASLKVLRLQIVKLVNLPSLLPSFVGLHVLDLSLSAPSSYKGEFGIDDFPHLHTIGGPLEVICPAFASARLPSLRTLICSRYSRSLIQGLMQFFANHGSKITCLDHRCEPVYGQSYLALCPNVTDLVISWSHTATLRFQFINVTTVGLAGAVTADFHALRMLLYAFDVFEFELEEANFPKLRKIRVLEKESSQSLLRHSSNELRLYDRRLRGWSIQLEDGYGNRLVPLT